jgi:hypothetical protein
LAIEIICVGFGRSCSTNNVCLLAFGNSLEDSFGSISVLAFWLSEPEVLGLIPQLLGCDFKRPAFSSTFNNTSLIVVEAFDITIKNITLGWGTILNSFTNSSELSSIS